LNGHGSDLEDVSQNGAFGKWYCRQRLRYHVVALFLKQYRCSDGALYFKRGFPRSFCMISDASNYDINGRAGRISLG